MTVRVTFDLTDAQYRALLPVCNARQVSVNVVARDRVAGLAEALIDGRAVHHAGVVRPAAHVTVGPLMVGSPVDRNPKGRVHYDATIRDRIRALATAGWSPADAADDLGLTRSELARLARIAGVTFDTRRRVFTTEECALIRRLHTEGKSQRDIADALHVTSTNMIRRALLGLGLAPHPVGRRPKVPRPVRLAA